MSQSATTPRPNPASRTAPQTASSCQQHQPGKPAVATGASTRSPTRRQEAQTRGASARMGAAGHCRRGRLTFGPLAHRRASRVRPMLWRLLLRCGARSARGPRGRSARLALASTISRLGLRRLSRCALSLRAATTSRPRGGPVTARVTCVGAMGHGASFAPPPAMASLDRRAVVPRAGGRGGGLTLTSRAGERRPVGDGYGLGRTRSAREADLARHRGRRPPMART